MSMDTALLFFLGGRAVGQPGPPGPQGEAGPPGPRGERGPPGEPGLGLGPYTVAVGCNWDRDVSIPISAFLAREAPEGGIVHQFSRALAPSPEAGAALVTVTAYTGRYCYHVYGDAQIEGDAVIWTLDTTCAGELDALLTADTLLQIDVACDYLRAQDGSPVAGSALPLAGASYPGPFAPGGVLRTHLRLIRD